MGDLNLVKVKALSAFTKTTRHGQFHGNPDSPNPETRCPNVPDYAVASLIDSGRAELIDAVSAPPQRAGPESTAALAMNHLGFGKYEITGGGISEVVKGKKQAEARLAELEATPATAASDSAPLD